MARQGPQGRRRRAPLGRLVPRVQLGFRVPRDRLERVLPGRPVRDQWVRRGRKVQRGRPVLHRVRRAPRDLPGLPELRHQRSVRHSEQR
jgi:hypothetical protein